MIQFQLVDGIVLDVIKTMSTPDALQVLIVDEMNRANLPKIFGELMYLFEYRDEPIDLQYSKAFRLPRGLRFIGTMNTADRSIRSIDVALRRRFDVFECPPDAGVLERYYASYVNTVPDLVGGFEKLNGALRARLDRHHTIGHAFFMADPMTPERLRHVWDHKVAPLIEEYFFDQPDIAAEFVPEEYWPVLS
jgi:5-methylcytosine-specific restriction endonuclease McrBC GTP-binding regulatory subunit McrB